MLDDASQVIRALVRYQDIFDPRTSSVLYVGAGGRRLAEDPFRGGFLDGFEQRAELVRRLQRLAPREQELLYLWYVASWPVVRIGKELGVSRMHCYRLRSRALHEMTQPAE